MIVSDHKVISNHTRNGDTIVIDAVVVVVVAVMVVVVLNSHNYIFGCCYCYYCTFIIISFAFLACSMIVYCMIE